MYISCDQPRYELEDIYSTQRAYTTSCTLWLSIIPVERALRYYRSRVHFRSKEATPFIESMAPSPVADLAHIQEVKLQRVHGGYTSIYFASAIAAIIAIFACVHLLHHLHRRLNLRHTHLGRIISTWSTPLKSCLYGSKIYTFEFLPERVALAIIYFGINVGVSVWDIDWHHYTTFANRLGW
jgi:hypothetical protein